MDYGQRMHLRLAEVTPPPRHALGGKVFEAVPHPYACGGIGDVEHSGLAYPCSDVVGISGGVLCKHPGLAEHVVVVNGSDFVDIWLVDEHCVNAHAVERVKHAAMVGELVLVPFQTAHVGLLSIPVKVEHDTVNRIAALLERVDGTQCLLLVVVSVARGDVAERPERGQLLATGKLGVA